MSYLIVACRIVLQPSIMCSYPHLGRVTGKVPGSHSVLWASSTVGPHRKGRYIGERIRRKVVEIEFCKLGRILKDHPSCNTVFG